MRPHAQSSDDATIEEHSKPSKEVVQATQVEAIKGAQLWVRIHEQPIIKQDPWAAADGATSTTNTNIDTATGEMTAIVNQAKAVHLTVEVVTHNKEDN